MPRLVFPLLCAAILLSCWAFCATPASGQKVNDQLKVAPGDWPWWRGPDRNGVSRPDARPPTTWSETENVVWKSAVPGRGHGSPTVVGERVFLATCDEQKDSQSVLCYDRRTGRKLWETEVHDKGAMRKNPKSSSASSTPACDGERIYISFPNSGAIHATALGLDGKQVWQTKVSDYIIHQGYGSSPALYQSLVIVTADNKGGGAIAGLDRKSGKIVWKRDRPKTPNYASPIILNVAGRDQLVLTGCDLVSSFDPLSGQTLWEVDGATTECVTSTVTDGKHVYTSGGYPKNHLAAVVADGSGKVAWETTDRVYVPSLLVHEGHLFGTLDAGVAACWNAATGTEAWKSRLGGTFSASPVQVGDSIFATNESGETFVFLASSEKFTQLAMNKLGDEVLATPTICGGHIYMRVAKQVDGKRQEMLYCLGESKNN